MKAHFRYILGLTASEAEIADVKKPAFGFKYPPLPNENDDPEHPIFNPAKSLYYIDVNHRGDVSKIHRLLSGARVQDDDETVERLDDHDRDTSKLIRGLKRMHLNPLKFVCISLGFSLADTNKGQTLKEPWINFLSSWVCCIN